MNDLMSLGLHRLWKSFTISVARPRAGERVLDIATGTGDLAAALARRVLPGGEVWITDINRRMLERSRPAARRRAHAARGAMRRRAPAISAGYFDCVTVGFGLRNMTRKDAALREMARVLKPGGRLIVLEFSKVGSRSSRRTTGIRSRCSPGRATRSPGTPTPIATWRVDPAASRPGHARGNAARCWFCRSRSV